MKHFSLRVDINYEDTDAGGIVYYPNYLAYMERARAAFLRAHGFKLSSLVNDHNVIFVVTHANIHYISPAKLDDCIDVGVEVVTMQGPRFECLQEIRRGDELLVTGDIRLAILNSETRRPTRAPAFLREACLLQNEN